MYYPYSYHGSLSDEAVRTSQFLTEDSIVACNLVLSALCRIRYANAHTNQLCWPAGWLALAHPAVITMLAIVMTATELKHLHLQYCTKHNSDPPPTKY